MIMKKQRLIILDRKCDICKKTAYWDAPTIAGPWAYLCHDCLRCYGNPNNPLNNRITPSTEAKGLTNMTLD